MTVADPAPSKGVAVVTGAARGLGLAIATSLHNDGYQVLLTDADSGAVEVAAKSLGGWSARLDVRYEKACEVIAERAEERGPLALWVNNAGILAVGPSWTQSPATRRRLLEVNALGTMNGTLAALGVMRRRGTGHIINVVSLAGLVAVPGEAVYSASKHATIAFSLATLADLRMAGCRGIHISCLCPDGIWTPMLHDLRYDPGAAASFSGPLLSPQQVAQRVVRLAAEPRPVVSLPRWRGAQARLFDAFPRLSVPMAGLVLAVGRARQRRQARRVAAAYGGS
ncbi:MAG TPA: SDR family NAD(P)-dependent oxidoreductase [Micromonosporaceae bacterium]|nr:SDR family NAD(P)-dependent oxidoreductase [Micromonosporaceae bacterium]